MRSRDRRELRAALAGLRSAVLSYDGWTDDQSARAHHSGQAVAQTEPSITQPTPTPAPETPVQSPTATPWPVAAAPAVAWPAQPAAGTSVDVDRTRRHGSQPSTPAQEGIAR